jgi:hypothetical protein
MPNPITSFYRKLRPEQQQRLLLTAIGTVVVIAGLYFGLIRAQANILSTAKTEAVGNQDKLKESNRLIKMANAYQTELQVTANRLTQLEATMAPAQADLYSLMMKLVLAFRENQHNQKVEVQHVIPGPVGEIGVFPAFPYKAFPTAVDGYGQYHEIGKFVADFENAYPCFQVQNLELIPLTGTQTAEERDKLAFKMDIVALIAEAPAPR